MNKIICGDALTELRNLESESVDCCVTSPPYWGLRRYQTEPQIWGGDPSCLHEVVSAENFCVKCGCWKGELGREPTPDLFVEHLCCVFDEVKRVLKKTGTLWVNIADSYGGSGSPGGDFRDGKKGDVYLQRYERKQVLPKSLALVPFRLTIEMCKRGWILRNTVIWHKISCMPSSAIDRFTCDFEYVFFFTKAKRYFFEQQVETLAEVSIKRSKSPFNPNHPKAKLWREQHIGSGRDAQTFNKEVFAKIAAGVKLTRNKRCVWSISIQPFEGEHFAVFPEELVTVPILAGCAKEVCARCGKPKMPLYKVDKIEVNNDATYKSKYENTDCVQGAVRDNVVARTREESKKLAFQLFPDDEKSRREFIRLTHNYNTGIFRERKLVGFKPTCKCNAGFEPGVVLDPFIGSGTTAVVAKKLGLRYVGIELNPNFHKMAEERVRKVLSQMF